MDWYIVSQTIWFQDFPVLDKLKNDSNSFHNDLARFLSDCMIPPKIINDYLNVDTSEAKVFLVSSIPGLYYLKLK